MKEQFWDRIKKGDELAFCTLYEQYADMLYGYGMKIVADEDLVSDAIQSLFIYLFEKRKTIAEPNSISAYLCVSLRRLVLLEVKRRKKFGDVFIEDIPILDYNFKIEIDAEETMLRNEHEHELIMILQKALDELTSQQREIIYLKYYKGMDNGEVASVLNLSIQTVKNTASQALCRLRKYKKLVNSYVISLILFIFVIT